MKRHLLCLTALLLAGLAWADPRTSAPDLSTPAGAASVRGNIRDQNDALLFHRHDGSDGSTQLCDITFESGSSCSIGTANVPAASIHADTITVTNLIPSNNLRNAIINGNFDIWQRNTSFALTASAFTADRWCYILSGDARHTASRSSTVPSVSESGTLSNYSYKLDCTTADTSLAATDLVRLRYRIEGYDWTRLAQKTFTLSFWVRATKTGTYSVSFSNYGSDRSYTAEYSIGTTETWEKKTITVSASPSAGTWNYTNETGLEISWWLSAGSNSTTSTIGSWQSSSQKASSNQVNGTDSVSNDFYLAQVQLESGSVATPLEFRHFSTELALAQRYYEKSYDLTIAPGTSGQQIGFYAATLVDGTQVYATFIPFKVRKRNRPSVIVYDQAATINKITLRIPGNTINGVTPAGGSTEYGIQAVNTSANWGTGNVVGVGMYFDWTADSEI